MDSPHHIRPRFRALKRHVRHRASISSDLGSPNVALLLVFMIYTLNYTLFFHCLLANGREKVCEIQMNLKLNCEVMIDCEEVCESRMNPKPIYEAIVTTPPHTHTHTTHPHLH